MGIGAVLTEWGVAGKGLGGAQVSGDRHVVAPFPGGALVAVIDGLGHGPYAAVAAVRAATILAEHPAEPPAGLVMKCHRELQDSRGAVMSLASIDQQHDRLRWLGVGNVEGVLVRRGEREQRRSLLVRGGVVGYRLPTLQESEVELRPGDTLLMATDGVKPSALRDVPLAPTAEATAKAVLAAGAASPDDALVLAATYGGAA